MTSYLTFLDIIYNSTANSEISFTQTSSKQSDMGVERYPVSKQRRCFLDSTEPILVSVHFRRHPLSYFSKVGPPESTLSDLHNTIDVNHSSPRGPFLHVQVRDWSFPSQNWCPNDYSRTYYTSDPRPHTCRLIQKGDRSVLV